jgi:CubicO group peptidase (beta-lactamase class C family)
VDDAAPGGAGLWFCVVSSSTPVELTTATVSSAVDYWDSWLAFRANFERLPGVQAAVWHADALVLSTAHGLADIGSGTKLTAAHLFRVASHSKTFTATAVFRLLEAGRLRLDDPVDTWLGWMVGQPLGDRTLRELLAHGGGVIRDGHDGDFWQLARGFPDEPALRAAATDRADVLPANQEFKYSNVGYALLGQVIEAASGTSYGEFVKREVVVPLGLQNTGPELDPSRSDEYAAGYTSLAYAGARIPIDHVDTGALAAATGFFSTAEDMCRYASAHFLGDDRLLTDRSKRLMQRTEWKVEGAGSHYGLGFAIQEIGGRRLVGHGGGYPGHSTRTLLDPVGRFAVSVLTNAIDGSAMEMVTAAISLANLAAQSPGTAVDAAATDRLCGRFANLWGVLDVVRLGGRLFALDPTAADPAELPIMLDVTGPTAARLGHASGYGSSGETLEFDVGDDGRVRSIRGSSGMSWHPFEAFAAAVAGRDRVQVGSPIQPPSPRPPPRDPPRHPLPSGPVEGPMVEP